MRDDIDVFMSAYASAEGADGSDYCLAIAPFEWKWGDEYVTIYIGDSLLDCIGQAIRDGMIDERAFKKEMESAAWCAVRHVHGYGVEDVGIMAASFSPWEFVNLAQAIHATAPWRVERALMRASWYANADFCKVSNLWKK